MNLKLRYICDPGHGWLQVPKSIVIKSGVKKQITPYSYQDKDFFYLEEDCDASLFVDRAKELGWTVEFQQEHTNHDSFIRNLRSV